MKIKPRGWNAKTMITQEEHDKSFRKLPDIYRKWLPDIFADTNVFFLCRVHRNSDADSPCIYVFRNSDLAWQKSGLMLFMGKYLSEFHIVFRLFEKRPPLPIADWHSLEVNRRYRNSERLYRVRSRNDLKRANDLMKKCITIFDSIYEIEPLTQDRYQIDPTYILLEIRYPDEVPSNYPEGGKRTIEINVYERDAAARTACLRFYDSFECQICHFSFEDFYGEIGKQYIHVHHLKPFTQSETHRQTDPEKDLIPVCPNCHAMLHSGGSVLITPEELEIMIKTHRKK